MKNEPLPPQLAFACPKRWDDMKEDGPQRRFCDQCQLHVRDLSAMTERQGQQVLAEANDRLCVSYLVRPDGTMVTRARWEGMKRGWFTVQRAALTFLAMVLPFAFTSCNRDDRGQSSRLGGAMVMPSDDKNPPPTTLGRVRVPRTTGEPMPMRTAGAPLPVEKKTEGR